MSQADQLTEHHLPLLRAQQHQAIVLPRQGQHTALLPQDHLPAVVVAVVVAEVVAVAVAVAAEVHPGPEEDNIR